MNKPMAIAPGETNQYAATEGVLAALPVPDYGVNYQPAYADEEALAANIRDLHGTEPVTTPAQVDAVGLQLARIASGEAGTPIVIAGGCHEPVDAHTPISELVEQSTVTLNVVASSGLRNVYTILRNRGQSAKPRSSEVEMLPSGEIVLSYMGDAINGRASTDREPDPARMLEAAVQARDLERGLTSETGSHVPAAHEALLLPYERSFIHTDPATGRRYLLSADLPWIGKRTHSPDGDHVRMLAGVANPVGVKIGADSDPEHIADLAAALNPDNEPGKLVLMFRLGLGNIHRLPPLLRAVRSEAPGSILMSDIHGSTRTREDGKKVRLVGDVIKEAQAVAELCREAGLRMHGIHLETTADDRLLECIDRLDQDPQKGNVDPQLNPAQTGRVLDAIAPYVNSAPAG